MTFLELATAIDTAESRVKEADLIAKQAFDTLVEFKTKQFRDLEEEEGKVQKLRDRLLLEQTRLKDLFNELQGKLPGTPAPVAKPDLNAAELKALYQGGMKYRGNLG